MVGCLEQRMLQYFHQKRYVDAQQITSVPRLVMF